VQVRLTTCKFGQPTQDGSKSSGMRTTNSSIGRAAKYLMLKEVKTKKVKQLVFGVTMEVKDNYGTSFILIKQRVHKLRA